MNPPATRNITLATFGGHTYRTTGVDPDGYVRLCHDSPTPPPDPEFTRHKSFNVWVRTVPAEECDRVVRVTTTAKYDRHECHVAEISDDGMALLYLSQDAPGFEMEERGVYKKRVHVGELRDYRELHIDLLAEFAAKPPQPRLGIFVTIGGREYEANSLPSGGTVTIFSPATENPDPALFTRDEQAGHWVATVPTAECERIDSVTTRAYGMGEYSEYHRDLLFDEWARTVLARRAAGRTTEDLYFNPVSDTPRYAYKADGPVRYVAVANDDGVIGYLRAADGDDAAGYEPRAAAGDDAVNAGVWWYLRLRECKARNLRPSQALADLGTTKGGVRTGRLVPDSGGEASSLAALRALAGAS